MTDPAPYCAHRANTIARCYRRTRHESGLCPQHRPGHNGRGQRLRSIHENGSER